MPIDWGATGDMLSGIGSIGGAVAIVVAGLVGRNALSDYRRQKLVDREISAAEEALTAAYRALDAINHMRGRWIPGHETENAEKALIEAGASFEGMDENVKRAHITRGVIYRRAEFFKSDFDAIFHAIPLAQVYFGQQVVDWLKEFPKARNRMLNSADFLPMASSGNNNDQDRELVVQVRQDVFGTSDDKADEIRDNLADALAQLEKSLVPKLRSEKAN